MTATQHPLARRGVEAIRAWLRTAETSLGNASERLNAINIFPVADGDTGTNMYLTVRAAREAVEDPALSSAADLGSVLEVAGQAALDQARGNSGTLLAVIITAMAGPLASHDRLTAPVLAQGLNRAQTASWAALSDPQDGTLLTVLGVAAAAAGSHLDAVAGQPGISQDQLEGRRVLGEALDVVVKAMWRAVQGTERQLAALTQAQVVDAGAVGLLLVVDALRSTVMGVDLDPGLLDGVHGLAPQDEPTLPVAAEPAEHLDGHELMCSVRLDPLAAATLRYGLNEVGDSVIMSPMSTEPDADGAVRWRVHAHVVDPQAALELVEQAGVPENLVLEPLQSHEVPDCPRDTAEPTS